jgi:hypothetical protein
MLACVATSCTGSDKTSVGKSGGLLADLSHVSGELTQQNEPGGPAIVSWYSLGRLGQANGTDLSTPKAREEFWSNSDDRFLLARPDLFQATPKDIEMEFGFSSTSDVTSALEIQRPPFQVTVVRGQFDKAKIEKALGKAKGGIWSLGPEKDYEIDIEGRSAARRLGMGLRITQIDDVLVASTNRPMIEKLVASPKDNIAQASPWKELAAELDSNNVYTAVLAPRIGASPPPFSLMELEAGTLKKLQAEYEKTLIERPTAIGVGVTKSDGAVVVYTHDSESSAEMNEKLLEGVLRNGFSMLSARPLTELFTVKSIKRNKTTVTVEVSTPKPATMIQMLQQQDTGFASK